MSSKILIEKKKIDDDLIKLKTEASKIINRKIKSFFKKKNLLKSNEIETSIIEVKKKLENLEKIKDENIKKKRFLRSDDTALTEAKKKLDTLEKKKGLLKTDDSIIEAKSQLETLKKIKYDNLKKKALYKCNFVNNEKKIKKKVDNVINEYNKTKKKITPIINNIESLNNNIQKKIITNTNKIITDFESNNIQNQKKAALKLKKINEFKDTKENMLLTETEKLNKTINLINKKRDTDLNKINNEFISLKNNCNDILKIEIDKSKKEVDNRLAKGTNKKKRQVAFQKTKNKILNIFQYMI